ncbi:MAG: DUF3127 domain-containing protein [Tannerella sp.]|jgi:hypothetical protein|nr:DUF3127 domain-containing protein [Tannerella sp.]
MEIRGKIIIVQPLQTGEGKNGVWKKQDYVVEYDQHSQYPRKMMFNLWGDKIDQFNIQEGQAVKISFDIDCREYNGRWYNDIRAWKVEADDGLSADAEFSQPAAQAPSTPEMLPSEEGSDLPF